MKARAMFGICLWTNAGTNFINKIAKNYKVCISRRATFQKGNARKTIILSKIKCQLAMIMTSRKRWPRSTLTVYMLLLINPIQPIVQLNENGGCARNEANRRAVNSRRSLSMQKTSIKIAIRWRIRHQRKINGIRVSNKIIRTLRVRRHRFAETSQ